MSTWRLVAAGFLLAIGAASRTSIANAQSAQPTPPVQERSSTSIKPAHGIHWYIIRLNDAPTGWTRLDTKAIADGFRTETETRLRMARDRQILSMTTTSWIEEDALGRPIRGGQSQTGGGMSVRVAWECVGDGVRERRTQGAQVKERSLPGIERGALGPAAAQRAGLTARAEGKSDFTILSIDPSQGLQAQLNRWEKLGEVSMDIAGQPVSCTRWRISGPLIANGSEEWVDEQGTITLSQTPTGLGLLQNVLCDEAKAKSSLETAQPPVEVLVSSFVKMDRVLNDVHSRRNLTLLVSAKNLPIMPPPQEGFQRVKRNTDGSFTVTIDLDKPAEPSPSSVATDAIFLESSPMIDWNDPAVIALKDSALEQARPRLKGTLDKPAVEEGAPAEGASAPAGESDALLKAEAFRSAVARHVANHNLSSAFASASETAATRSGDCTESAVLLAALLRADGIPSRIAAGLVWADYFAGEKNVFAWHLWTQARIDGRWIDLDATLGEDGESFHVGHVLLAVTPLTDAAGDPAWSSLLSSMGNLSIKVSDGTNQ